MATQFAPSAPLLPHAAQPAAQTSRLPGLALAAVDKAFSALPPQTRDATLEELAAHDPLRNPILGVDMLSVSPALGEALRDFAAARAITARFVEQVERPRMDAFKKARAEVPHRETRTFVNALGDEVSLSTDDEADIANARVVLAWPRVEDHDAEWFEAHCELIGFDEQRTAEFERLRAEHRIEEMADEMGLLLATEEAANDVIIQTSPTSFADLLAKLKFIADENEVDDWIHDVIAGDVRRLAGAA